MVPLVWTHGHLASLDLVHELGADPLSPPASEAWLAGHGLGLGKVLVWVEALAQVALQVALAGSDPARAGGLTQPK